MSRSSPEPVGLTSVLTALLISVLWGGNLVSIRLGVQSIPPFWSAFWRMLLGVVFVAAWALHRGTDLRPRKGEPKLLGILGLLFTAQIALLNTATTYTSPAYGVVILNSYAIFANLAGHFGGRYFGISEEPITPVRALGLALALSGVGWLVLGHPDQTLAPQPLLGNTLMVVSALFLGIRQVYTRWLVQSIDPTRSIVWQMIVSVPLFLAMAAVSEPLTTGELRWEPLAAIGYQGIIVAGFCFIAWAKLLKRHAAGTLSMFAFAVPVSGVLLSSLLFGETLRPSLFTGTALVLIGMFVVIRLGQRRA